MSYGLSEFGACLYAGPRVETPPTTPHPILAVEIAFTTGALEEPVWVDVTHDVRSWDVSRGRSRELERFQPGRATVVLSNLQRQYDSQNADGPWYGMLRPMRRIRIRETFNGVTYPVFDGFVDRWLLDYPLDGHDATATIVATDAFKIFARTDLARSVYTTTVDDDQPVVWWRLDENLARLQEGKVLNAGSLAAAGDGTFVGPPGIGGQSLVVNDPGSSLVTKQRTASDLSFPQGVFLDNSDFSLLSESVWSVEAWARVTPPFGGANTLWMVGNPAEELAHAGCSYLETEDETTGRFRFVIFDPPNAYGVETASGSVKYGEVHHVVCVVEADGQMVIYLDGVRVTTTISGATGSNISGATPETTGDFTVAHEGVATPSATNNWAGEVDEVAIYDKALSAERVMAHYEAGAAPWQGDLPGERAGRVLDEVGWPAAWREIDAGDVTLQSAALGTTALEHLQKVAESEFGLLFMDRVGNVRLVSRDAVFARTPEPAILGDGPGEVGYRAIKFDDGDAVIRNRATISRYNGVAQRAEDAGSVEEFGRFDYTLEGLLHQSDAYSADYAGFIVDEYAEPRRRVVSLTLGPTDDAATYEQMLGRELGEAVTVKNRPPGGGDPFEQVSVIESIRHSGAPGAVRVTVWGLSPEFSGSF